MDRALQIYRQMSPEERRCLSFALRGFDAAVAPAKGTPAEQAQFEELGTRAAEEGEPTCK